MNLKLATVAFTAALGVHGADHLRRGVEVVQPAVFIGGALQAAVAVVVLGLVLREHPSSAAWAMGLGFGSVIVFAQAHVLPHWGPLSDSFLSAPRVTPFSWVTAVLEMGMGLVLGLVAMRTRRGRDRRTYAGGPATAEA